jgi:4-aminobutyrate aminotransferase
LNLDNFNDIGEAVVDYIENTIFHSKVPGNEVAAIFVEPILGEGGYIIPPESFFPALRDLCDRYGILLVADEIQSGIGRTGKWWAIEHFGVEPDIVTTAKGLASGMPLGVMFARKSLMTWKPGAHGSTFGGNPICCAAAVATLNVIENGLLDNVVEMGDYLLNAFRDLESRYSSIGNVRGKGLMIGMDFVEDHKTKAPAAELRDDVANRAFAKGLLVLPCGWGALRLIPPLNVDKAISDEAMTILDEAIAEAEAAR